MKHRNTFGLKVLTALLAMVSSMGVHGDGFRELAGANGGILVAEIVAVDATVTKVILRTPNGGLMGLPMDKLSEEDQNFITGYRYLENWQSRFDLLLEELTTYQGNPKFKMRSTGTFAGTIANLKVEVSTTNPADREKPCDTVWYFLAKDEDGGLSWFSMMIQFKDEDQYPRGLSGSTRSDAEQNARYYIRRRTMGQSNVNGSELRRFEVSPKLSSYSEWREHFTLSGNPSSEKRMVIAYRVEAWQDGQLRGAFEHPKAQMRETQGIPKNWWIVNNYKNEIDYTPSFYR